MSKKLDKTKIANEKLDRRVKLLTETKLEIIKLYETGSISINQLARNYKVNKRLIQFILFPERLAENRRLRAERGGSNLYYDREEHNEAMRTHRSWKRFLLESNLITLNK